MDEQASQQQMFDVMIPELLDAMTVHFFSLRVFLCFLYTRTNIQILGQLLQCDVPRVRADWHRQDRFFWGGHY